MSSILLLVEGRWSLNSGILNLCPATLPNLKADINAEILLCIECDNLLVSQNALGMAVCLYVLSY